MQVFIVIGARGTGKSTFVEQRAKMSGFPRERIWMYDPERRYYDLSITGRKPGMPLMHIDDFSQKTSMLQNCFICYEEGTVFFPNRGSNKDLRMALVQSRYNGNIIFIIYHSICAVPYYVYELADCVFLFKTNDEENRVAEKYEKLLPFWYELRHYPDDKITYDGKTTHVCREFELLNGKISPYHIIKL